MPSSLTQHIAKYKLWDLSIFPVIHKDKKPAIKSWAPYQKRKPDEAELLNWFSDNTTNVAIVCGGVSGNLVVLDFDNVDLYLAFSDYWQQFYSKPIQEMTPIVQTGGGGYHVYLKAKQKPPLYHPVGEERKHLPDIQSEGGYVLAPPSIHPSGNPYRFLNPEVKTIHEVKSISELALDIPDKRQVSATGGPGWVTKALAGVSEGERDNTCIRLAAYFRNKHPKDITTTILTDFAAKCTPPLDEATVRKCVDSAYRYQHGEEWSGNKTSCGRMDFHQTISQWLYVDDIESVDILMATALSVYLPGDPIWLFLIAPAGGSKTELLRAFSGKRVYTVSTLTPQTLISGLKGSSDTDLLPKLDGKVLIVKDFTSILSKKSEDQAAIFADLREAYDGYLEKSYGSGVGTKRYRSRFGLIAGVTDAIDMFRVVHSLLGERFLKCRVRANAEEAIDKAGEVAGREEEMRSALRNATDACLNYYARQAEQNQILPIEREIHQRIKALGNVTAKLRSEVARDRYHKVLYQPQAEVGTRLTKQFLKLGQSLSIFYEHDCVGEDEYRLLLRVAKDSIPAQRIKLVSAMLGSEPLDTKKLGDRAGIPTDTAREHLEDLWMLNLVDRTGDSTFQWALHDDVTRLLKGCGLWTQNTLSKHKN